MALDSIRRLAITGPITAVTYDGSHQVLYAGSGGQLLAYMNVGVTDESANVVSIGPIDLFSTHTIHGVRPVESRALKIVAFGGKAVCIVAIHETVDDNQSNLIHQLVIETLFEDLDDLVLDCTVVDHILLIGFAHNFIDVLIQGNQSGRYERISRVQCREISALFSLSIVAALRPHVQQEYQTILVASGTAFGKIILWNFQISSNKVLTEQSVPVAKIDDILINHEGVIFRLQWSKNRSRIASVSDDRTVRVWDLTDKNKGQQVYIGWGHISRLWDVIFLGELEDRVATCSEDGTIKIWDLKKDVCVVTLRGHASDIWCLTLASLPSMRQSTVTALTDSDSGDAAERVAVEDLVLFSGGNDGSVKAWPLIPLSISCPEDPTQTLKSYLIPRVISVEGEVTETVSGSRRANGVSSVKLSPDGVWAVVGLCDGGIWLTNFHAATHTSKAHTAADKIPSEETGSVSGWKYLGQLNKGITNADVKFVEDECQSGDETQGNLFSRVSCSHPDGFVTLVDVFKKKSPANLVEYSTNKCTWKAHDLRTINVWHVELKSEGRSLTADRSRQYLVTTSVKGVCRLWGETPEEFSQGSTDTTRMPYELLLTCVTGKEQVATCILLLRDTLVVGDSRGGVSIFRLGGALKQASKDCGEHSAEHSHCPVSADVYVPHAHGTDLVSCLESNRDGGYYSAGHDGSFCVFTGDGELVSRLKCLPIKSPDKIFIVGEGEGLSYYVGGYLGGLYLVQDIRRGYQVMRIEGGGWKRPHHAVLYVPKPVRTGAHKKNYDNVLPRVVFVCPAPVNNDTVLLFCDSQPCVKSDPRSEFTNLGSQSSRTVNIPLHLGCPSHGKVTYCSRIICSSSSGGDSGGSGGDMTDGGPVKRVVFVVVGGEDGNVKIFRHSGKVSQSLVKSSGQHERGKNVPEFLQEVNMPGNVAVKAIAFAPRIARDADREVGSYRPQRGLGSEENEREIDGERSKATVRGSSVITSEDGTTEHNEGILVAVGGRLSYSIWEYNLYPFSSLKQPSKLRPSHSYQNEGGQGGESSSRSVLSFVVSGTVSQKLSQDHRILSVQCVRLPSKDSAYVQGVRSKEESLGPMKEERMQGEAVAVAAGSMCAVSVGAASYLIVMGDSRGSVTVSTYTQLGRTHAQDTGSSSAAKPHYPPRKNRLSVIEEFQVQRSGCPVLSCDVIILSSNTCFEEGSSHRPKENCQSSSSSSSSGSSGDGENSHGISDGESSSSNEACCFIGIFGDTAGVVSVWLLAGSTVPSISGSQKGARILESSRQLLTYKAHAMGANTLSVLQTESRLKGSDPTHTRPNPHPYLSSGSISLPLIAPITGTPQEPKDPTPCQPSFNGPTWGLVITSGGDDQAITVCTATLSLVHSEEGLGMEISHAYNRADGCSGSAIKGVKAFFTPSSSLPRRIGSDNMGVLNRNGSNANDGIVITSVGYDQRLSVWKPRHSALHAQGSLSRVVLSDSLPSQIVYDNAQTDDCSSGEDEEEEDEDEEDGIFTPANVDDITTRRDELLEWMGGIAIHVGDVCALDAVQVRTEGTEISRLTSSLGVLSSRVPDGVGRPSGRKRSTVADEEITGSCSEMEIAIVVGGEGFQLLTATIR